MRHGLGRPGLSPYVARMEPFCSDGEVTVTFAGVSTLLFSDGDGAVMTDGFFSRPSLLRVGLTKLSPDVRRIDEGLARMGVDRLDAVLPVHGHYDHALDTAVVARRTGAQFLGDASTANIARGGGLGENRIAVVTPGSHVECGAFTLSLHSAAHSPPDRFPGTIRQPVVPPAKTGDYRCGQAWSVHVEHTSGRTALVHGSAGWVDGALDGVEADVVYLGVGQLGFLPEEYVREYWQQTVRAVGARRVILIHWDDFFRGLDRPLRALPRLVDDLDRSWRILAELAIRDGVTLGMPALLAPTDPWRS